jgi:glycosyltransferase involved in cell wall biosynthesis/SAM-dependent methyltransferase
MTGKPLVSVIIIFLNEEKFLQEAIGSVFAQTYDNWELLLVDDGSTDASTKIALQYANEYPEKVRYLEHHGHQNRGMSAARNLGIRKAKGEYIAFLDADDVWLPNILDEQVAILEGHPTAAMVYGALLWWYSWTGNPDDIPRDHLKALRVPPDTLVKPPTPLIQCLLGQGLKPSGYLIRRQTVEAVGGFEEDFWGLNEDQVFCAKVCLKETVFVSGQCWYKYRQHSDSACAVAKTTAQWHPTRSKFLNWLEAYLTQQGARNTEVWNVLKKELWPYRHPVLHRLFTRGSYRIGQIERLSKRIARRISTASLPDLRRMQRAASAGHPPVGRVGFGSLRGTRPISRRFGLDRGLPIDRYYIERFLSAHASDVRGHVLEIGSDTYTHRFGRDRVIRSDVLFVAEGNPKATIVADLTSTNHIPSGIFDCILLTQTLQFIYDVRAALKTLYRILKPDGILLATFPGISQISRYDMDRWGDYWRFTSLSSRRLFEEVFPSALVAVEAHGNVLAALTFLHGLAVQELRPEELDFQDPDYEVLIAVRAVKPPIAR